MASAVIYGPIFCAVLHPQPCEGCLQQLHAENLFPPVAETMTAAPSPCFSLPRFAVMIPSGMQLGVNLLDADNTLMPCGSSYFTALVVTR